MKNNKMARITSWGKEGIHNQVLTITLNYLASVSYLHLYIWFQLFRIWVPDVLDILGSIFSFNDSGHIPFDFGFAFLLTFCC